MKFIILYSLSIFVPILMLIFGRLMKKYPPKNINGMYGYRTKRSRKNIESWTYANKRFGELWIKIAIILLISAVFWSLLFLRLDIDTALFIISILVLVIELPAMLVPILIVEKELKEKY